MTDNDRRLLEATAGAIKLLLDAVVRNRITLVDQVQAQALSAEIAAVLTRAHAVPEAVPLPPPELPPAPPAFARWRVGAWMFHRLRG
ncbi:conserved protein of unknown function [Rhodovastum atsumiense]|uniref:Uncharacterized protein n=1 Tax=Rhodovastum atsumiense TaxID=504468 RepID=A0A5M6IXM9_9PROT|nr:hypothetical protein [Rhodovastum atsumiense]KAA5612587.1 hypothetical protein F1189_09020 [Rhodovastum atsumiense]CAH2601317.1 conserved protein of unknown function [Rhodovastum atsumiense]